MDLDDKIITYTASDGKTAIDVKLENETVWLNVNQMAELFSKEASNVRRHVINVFKEGELEKDSNVHFLHVPFSDKPVPFYSLDVIISVGYRVKSQRGTQFRIWANRILKEYLVKGYTINNSIASQKYEELCQLVQILGRTVTSQPELSTDENHELINVVSDYTYALDTLDRYDYQQLSVEKTTKEEPFHATYDNAMAAIEQLKEKFGESRWFGNEKDDSFRSSIGQIYQTFGGVDLYPSVQLCCYILSQRIIRSAWEQAYRCYSVPVVYAEQWYSIWCQSQKAHKRWNTRCTNLDDC